MIIPQNGKWVSSGQADNVGTLWGSFNLDLTSKPGKTLISPRTIITTNDLTDLDTTVAFATFTDVNAAIQYLWAVSGKYVWRVSLNSAGYEGAFAKDAATGTPTGGANTSCSSDASDLVTIDKTYMVVSLTDRLYVYTASTGQWLNVQYDTGGTPTPVTVTSGGSHIMEVYNGRLYVVDNNLQIRSVATNNLVSADASNPLTSSGTNFLDLTTRNFSATCISDIKRSRNGLWVGTVNQANDGCFVLLWDGVNPPNYSNIFLIPEASGVMGIAIKDDSPWVLDNLGQLHEFTGVSFRPAKNGRLPVKNAKFLKNPTSTLNDRWVHKNGFKVGQNGRLQALVNGQYQDNSGSIEENLPSGLWEYDPDIGWYHKMSLSLYTNSVTDFGQFRVSRVGAIYPYKKDATNAQANGSILLGAEVYTDATTLAQNIYIDDTNDTLQKFGYLVTSKFYSPNVSEVWDTITPRIKRFLDSGDKLWIKYRTTEESPTEATITWTGTNTFTTTTNIDAYYDTTDANSPVGYEVEILQGKGGGKCSRITNIVNNGGTRTVTLAETFPGATSGTAKARFQKWKELDTITSQSMDFKEIGVKAKSPWIQFKICFLATGKDELADILIGHKPHISTI